VPYASDVATLQRVELLVRIGTCLAEPSSDNIIGLVRLGAQLAGRREDPTSVDLRALRRGGMNAALIHLEEAERLYPAESWRHEVADARRSLIQALGVETESESSAEYRADIEMQLALVSALLGDRDGVTKWLQKMGSTLCRAYDAAGVADADTEGFIERLSTTLADFDEKPVFRLVKIEREPAPAEITGSWFFRALEKLGFEESVVEKEWPTDPRSDPIGWG
jgi:hypothetical protein